MKVWVFIWRLNPPHLWHLNTIKKSLEQDDKTIVILGSANIVDENNPFLVEERKELIEINFKKEAIIIDFLDDTESDLDWTLNIKDIIFKHEKNITELSFYGWDFENDYAIQVLKQFEIELWFNNINFIEYNRKTLYFEHYWKKNYYSSTLVRESMNKKDKEILGKLLSPIVYKKIINK